MAQALFDVLAAGVASMDNQAALAVQSLLESQAAVITETATTTTTSCLETTSSATADDDDVFQCGKCKKQFTSLSIFMAHKREQCLSHNAATLQIQASPSQLSASPGTSSSGSFTSLPAFTRSLTISNPLPPQVSATYATVPASPLTQSVVLNEAELLSLTTNMETGALTLPGTTQIASGLFLPQVNPTSASTVSLLTTVPMSQPIFVTAQTSPTSTVPTVVATTMLKQTPSIIAKPVTTNGKTSPLSKNNTVNIITEFHTTMVKPKKRGSGQIGVDGTGKKVTKLGCAYCNKVFYKNFDLQQHIRSHTGEKPFQCIVCGRAFAQKSNVKKHMQTHKVWPDGLAHTLPRQPLPKIVDEQNTSSTLEDQHPNEASSTILGTHGLHVNASVDQSGQMQIIIDNSYICQYCNQSFKTYFELKTHLKLHKNEQVYKCILKTCGLTFQELDAFLEHTKSHEHEMSYRCHLCSKSFPSLYELGVHQYSHSLYPNSDRPGPRYYRCTRCMNKYATPEALDHHMATTTHTYPCPHCDKIFPCERYLRRHLPTHGTLGLHSCRICDKSFKTEHYLKMHLLIHSGEKPFQCSQCSASFNRKDKLKRHQLIHEPIKRYKCPFRSHVGCLKEFNRPDKLKAHILTHTGLKPFRCKHCSRTFSRKPHLREHERLHHEDYRFHCDSCQRGFLREKQLKAHICGEKEKRKRVIRIKVSRVKRKMISTGPEEDASPRKRGRPRKKIDEQDNSSLNQTNAEPIIIHPTVVSCNETEPRSMCLNANTCSTSVTDAVIMEASMQTLGIITSNDTANLNSEGICDTQQTQSVTSLSSSNMVQLHSQTLHYTDAEHGVAVMGPDGVLHCPPVILTVTPDT